MNLNLNKTYKGDRNVRLISYFYRCRYGWDDVLHEPSTKETTLHHFRDPLVQVQKS